MNSQGPSTPSSSSRKPSIARLSDHEIDLPEGVTVPEWALERRAIQNPRIRSLLGCVQSLESVFDSNYALLHCSPQRLHEIWRRVRQIASLIEEELAPLFDKPSCIPLLETDRRKTLMALEIIESTVLRDLAQFPAELESGQMKRVRKLLCVSIGKLHAFLQDALARTLASDPRSRFDADYFLSRRFPHDVEEAEWLLASVEDLETHLESVHTERVALLVNLAESIGETAVQIDDDEWRGLLGFLDHLERELVPHLREVLSLRGIRFDEMEVLDRYARELPLFANLVRELGSHTRDVSRALVEIGDRGTTTRTEIAAARKLILGKTNSKLSTLMVSLDERLRDLEAFVPFWLQEIGRRRALMLRSADKPALDKGREQGRSPSN